MGTESRLRDFGKKIAVEVVGVDMEEETEAAFDSAVDKSIEVLGNLDAFVHCYTYEGIFLFFFGLLWI